MKCTNCGADIPEDKLYCESCGKELQIVPDYNPLDEVLAAQVKGAIRDTERMEWEQVRQSQPRKRQNSGRIPRQTEQERRMREREQQRRQMEKRKARAKKKRIRAVIILCILLAVAAVLGLMLYQNSYTGQVNKGYKAVENGEYDTAMKYFLKAIEKNDTRRNAYEGISSVYFKTNDLENGEQWFLNAIAEQPSNVTIYEVLIQFYTDDGQMIKITELLEACEDDNVIEELEVYVSKRPEYSLSDEEVFDEVQDLSLTSNGTIYYTDDDTEPTKDSIKYTQPILLQPGETIIRAFSINEKGVPSLEVQKTYIVELPIEDAPAVTPSTGQYEEPMTIEIKVPEGYTAYYTLNGDTPTEASHRYTGEPIPMREGSTLFSAVLIDSEGRVSDVTTRNYELTYE